jgi:DNA-binding FrmR family transcriptional regulator
MALKTSQQLINNIIGQLNGIKNMLAEEKECILVMNQMKAVRAAFNSLVCKYLSEQTDSCLKKSGTEIQKEKIRKLITQIMNKY